MIIVLNASNSSLGGGHIYSCFMRITLYLHHTSGVGSRSVLLGGRNSGGQLGLGDITNRLVPTSVPNPDGAASGVWVQVSCGQAIVFALLGLQPFWSDTTTTTRTSPVPILAALCNSQRLYVDDFTHAPSPLGGGVVLLGKERLLAAGNDLRHELQRSAFAGCCVAHSWSRRCNFSSTIHNLICHL